MAQDKSELGQSHLCAIISIQIYVSLMKMPCIFLAYLKILTSEKREREGLIFYLLVPYSDTCITRAALV